MISRAWVAALGATLLAACASTPPAHERPAPIFTPPISSPHGVPTPSPPPLTQAAETPTDFAHLPGWNHEDHLAALAALRSACPVIRDPAMMAVCADIPTLVQPDDAAARAFLEHRLRPRAIDQDGLLTAYFSPVYEARATPGGEFTAPLRPRPGDLVDVDAGLFDPTARGHPSAARRRNGLLVPYDKRGEIEARPAPDAQAWLRPEDLFFLQIQGSGVLLFPDGGRRKAVFEATNGATFVGIAGAMQALGIIAPKEASALSVHAWLAAHRGPEADRMMRLNPRYVFFRLTPDDGKGPIGAAGAPLIPGRSIAVDPVRHPMGALFWIDASAPSLTGAFPVYRRLAVALDTGGAIKGEVRADLYTGVGSGAGEEAGRVRHTLHLYELVPAP